MKKTHLNEWHKDHGGKMVEYAGWEMPVQYDSGLTAEHLYTRSVASLFDVSHMGEFRFEGKDALKFVDFLSPSAVTKLSEGESCYSFFPNEKGGVVDDLLIYCFKRETNYLICVNASNTEKIEQHIKKNTGSYDVVVSNESSKWGQVALQGPKSLGMMDALFQGASEIPKFGFKTFEYQGLDVCVARTGYTGEDGFEVFVPSEITEAFWNEFIERGAKPCGLGARDSLRLEAALNLYGNELSEDCNPFERRLGWTIDFEKTDFLARTKLLELKENAKKRLTGLKVLERAIPRAGYEVILDDQVVGLVTSGTMSPSLGEPIAMVWIDKRAAQGEKHLKVQVRKRQVDAKITKLPFLK